MVLVGLLCVCLGRWNCPSSGCSCPVGFLKPCVPAVLYNSDIVYGPMPPTGPKSELKDLDAQ